MYTRRTASVLFFLAFAAAVQAGEKPNVVFIFADDMGFGDLTTYNEESLVETPNLDQLAREGIRFTDAHTSSSWCVPSRYALMTGEHMLFRGGHRKLSSASWDTIQTLPRMLTQNGYETAMLGKWHLSWNAERREDGKQVRVFKDTDFSKPMKGGPLSWGFDSCFGITCQAPISGVYPYFEGRNFVDVPNWDPTEVLPLLTKKAVDYIRKRKGSDRPFFLYFALNSPHTPLVPEDRFITTELDGKHLYFPYVKATDWSAGEVLKVIDEAGMRDNTLVIFTSDNGSTAIAYDGTNRHRDFQTLVKESGHRTNGPWRGLKKQSWEGGHRVPFIIRWPGKVKPNTVSGAPFMVTDTYATVAEILGVTLRDDVAIDSVNVLDIWQGKATKEDYRNRVMVHADLPSTGTAVRQGKWKLHKHGRIDVEENGPLGLYDLESDPQEKNDLSENHPEVVERLTELLDAEKARKYRVRKSE